MIVSNGWRIGSYVAYLRYIRLIWLIKTTINIRNLLGAQYSNWLPSASSQTPFSCCNFDSRRHTSQSEPQVILPEQPILHKCYICSQICLLSCLRRLVILLATIQNQKNNCSPITRVCCLLLETVNVTTSVRSPILCIMHNGSTSRIQ